MFRLDEVRWSIILFFYFSLKSIYALNDNTVVLTYRVSKNGLLAMGSKLSLRTDWTNSYLVNNFTPLCINDGLILIKLVK